eukprot:768421-Hanusia_phi.AAC.2
MEEFDDQLPARKFDNFQFVPFERVMRCVVSSAHESRVPPGRNPDAVFAMHALMEIPEQFKIIRRLKYL